MSKWPRPRSQTWRTFLRNHAPDIAAVDLFVVPTIGFGLLYGLVIVGLGRRRLIWVNVTANPTAEWIARQLTEAFPWDQAPRHLIRDRDGVYGNAFLKRLNAMGYAIIRCATIAVAKCVCRKINRLDSARSPRPRRGFWRRALAPNSLGLCGLLQPRPHALVIAQRFSDPLA